MTELEMQRARRLRQSSTTWRERFMSWWRALVHDDRKTRRQRVDRKAEVERKARQSL